MPKFLAIIDGTSLHPLEAANSFGAWDLAHDAHPTAGRIEICTSRCLRRTYGVLAIATRHPRLFNRMQKK